MSGRPFFDTNVALVLAAALEAECTTLYSEDQTELALQRARELET